MQTTNFHSSSRIQFSNFYHMTPTAFFEKSMCSILTISSRAVNRWDTLAPIQRANELKCIIARMHKTSIIRLWMWDILRETTCACKLKLIEMRSYNIWHLFYYIIIVACSVPEHSTQIHCNIPRTQITFIYNKIRVTLLFLLSCFAES